MAHSVTVNSMQRVVLHTRTLISATASNSSLCLNSVSLPAFTMHVQGCMQHMFRVGPLELGQMVGWTTRRSSKFAAKTETTVLFN